MKESWEFSKKILPSVSRTFALNINKLKGPTHRAVLTGYLLFRIADCLEDSVFQEEEQKAENLLEFASIFEARKTQPETEKTYSGIKDIWKEDSPERELLLNGEKVFDVYFSLPHPHRHALAGPITETAKGMAEFQRRKASSDGEIYQIKDFAELKHYCYYAAGVVGKMLTEVFSLKKNIMPLKEELKKYQKGFGWGLQVTNIAKDWEKDMERGWLYVPKTVVDISKGDLPPKKKTTVSLSTAALEGLEDAVKYISIIPEEEKSVRLFCIIPMILACATLLSLLQGRGNKISREVLYRLLDKSEKFASDNNLLQEEFNKFSKKARKAFPQ